MQHSITDCILSQSKSYVQLNGDGVIISATDEAATILKAMSPIGQKLTDLATRPDMMDSLCPTELKNEEWIYSCCHKVGDDSVILYFEDPAKLKAMYTEIMRHPVDILTIRKLLSIDTPDFVPNQTYSHGSSLILKISKHGLITNVFPYTDEFLSISLRNVQNHSIMELIHLSDQLVLSAALSECHRCGISHFIIRFHPRSMTNYPVRWLLCQAKRQENDILLSLTHLEPHVEQSTWSYYSAAQSFVSTVPSTAILSLLPSMSLPSFFSRSTIEKSSVETDKM